MVTKLSGMSALSRIESLTSGERISKKKLSTCLKELRALKNCSETMGIVELNQHRENIGTWLKESRNILNGQGSKILKAKLKSLGKIEGKACSYLNREAGKAESRQAKIAAQNESSLKGAVQALSGKIDNLKYNIDMNKYSCLRITREVSNIQEKLTARRAKNETSLDVTMARIQEDYPYVLAKLSPDFLSWVRNEYSVPSSFDSRNSVPIWWDVISDKFLMKNFGYENIVEEGRYGDKRVDVPNYAGREFRAAVESLCPRKQRADIAALEAELTGAMKNRLGREEHIQNLEQQLRACENDLTTLQAKLAK